jgi:hypothetical protein
VTRQRLLTALITTVLTVLFAVAVFGRGCSEDDSTPEGAVRAFVAASREADKHAMWELLGPDTRKVFEDKAREATDRVGSNVRYSALDMLDVTVPEASYEPSDVIVRERHGDQATVDVLGPAGRRDIVRVVKVRKRWKVELR